LRPLSHEQLEYARMDTHFLITLRHLLAKNLRDRSLWEQARDSFAKACSQEIPERCFALQGYRRIHGFRNLSRISKLVLEALYLYRDRRARELDRAPFRVMSNEVLLRMANHRPTNLEELQKTGGLPRPYRNGRLAGELLAVVQQALRTAGAGTADDPPGIPDHDPIQGPGTVMGAYHTPSGENR
jgi:ribonuclease D